MVAHFQGCRELASFNLAVACARLGVVWSGCRLPSSRQCCHSRAERDTTVSLAAAGHRRGRAQLHGSFAVCLASFLRRIGGLGCGTQKCFMRILPFIEFAGLWLACPPTTI